MQICNIKHGSLDEAFGCERCNRKIDPKNNSRKVHITLDATFASSNGNVDLIYLEALNFDHNGIHDNFIGNYRNGITTLLHEFNKWTHSEELVIWCNKIGTCNEMKDQYDRYNIDIPWKLWNERWLGSEKMYGIQYNAEHISKYLG